jgi:phosphatidylglycerophosphate synthase
MGCVKKETFAEFKEKAIHKRSTPVPILFIEPITIRLAYLISRFKLRITPTQVTLTRLLIFFPLVGVLIFLAPIYKLRLLYLLIAIFSYIALLTDWLDGELARGTGKTSTSGAFLDSISDRIGMLIFFLIIFSIGLWLDNLLLVYGSVLLFLLKSVHMTVVNMSFYYDAGKTKDKNHFFSDESATKKLGLSILFSLVQKIAKKIGLRRWNGSIEVIEQYFVTIILLPLLFYFDLEKVTVYMSYALLIFFFMFYIIRIFSLIKSFVANLNLR